MYNEIEKISEIIGEVDVFGLPLRYFEGIRLIYLDELEGEEGA